MTGIKEQIECVKREIAMRYRVYPNWVKSGKMKQWQVEIEITRMEAVLESLQKVAQFEEIHAYLIKNFPKSFLGKETTAANFIAVIERAKVLNSIRTEDVESFLKEHLPNVTFSDFEKRRLHQLLKRTAKDAATTK